MGLILKTGYVVIVKLENNIGSQQGGIRPAVVVSNNVGNTYSNTIKVIPGTTKRLTNNQPTHAHFTTEELPFLKSDTTFEAECSWVVNKFQVLKVIGELNDDQLERIAEAMAYDTPLIYKAFQNGVQNNQMFKRISV